MCTVLFGWNALGPGTLLLAGNRDEDPARPADGPRSLHGSPAVAGGRDRQAGGTWLAIRERRSVVAVLNRRDPNRGVPDPRRPSRGWLAIAVAAAGDGHPERTAAAARLLLGIDGYAPCSLLIAGPEGAFVVANGDGGGVRVARVEPGWHVLTHAELDDPHDPHDPHEPRAAWLASALREFHPPSVAEAEAQLGRWLASHGAPGPAVCLHEALPLTVSTSRVWLAEGEARYSHGEGPACRAVLVDHSPLLHSN